MRQNNSATSIDLPMPILSSLTALSTRPKTITLADPDDIVSTEAKWSAEQLLVSEEERGHPHGGFKLEIKPGAVTFNVVTRRLTSTERELCEAILETAVPPDDIVEKPAAVRGEPPQRVRIGYKFDDLAYRKELAKLQKKQDALVVLIAVEGLREEAEGADDTAKVENLRAKLDEKLIAYLAREIWNRTYSAGDPADFFTSANSSAIPS
jgi:hypothetical protein